MLTIICLFLDLSSVYDEVYCAAERRRLKSRLHTMVTQDLGRL